MGELRDLIHEKVDIYEYLSQYLEFEDRNGKLYALSPFTEERTPSFYVEPEKKMFYDFSSHSGGDVITFVQKYHKLTFTEAIKHLQTYAGIENTTDSPSTGRRLVAVSELKKLLPKKTGEKPPLYTVLPDDIMNRYEKDYEKLKIWMDEGIKKSVLEKFQVRYDPFSNRIVHPIRKTTGEIINICGRTLDPQFKEKRIRKYTYTEKMGILDTMFGWYEQIESIKKKQEIIIFEGAKSVMKAEGWGFDNAVAALTSTINPYQYRLLIRLGVDVVIAFDEDVDAERLDVVKRLKKWLKVSVVINRDGLLGEKMSPVDMGEEIWKELYNRRVIG